jgi:hypothetical protein|tara:strand:+ start:190 stop:606 length:417 start_codon:yes stop_codon:yes gene_type:complete
MSNLVNHLGEPIGKTVDESKLPTTEQILNDPITKKFVFLNSDAHPNQTCIGLTSETDFHGVIYKYGKVTLPEEIIEGEVEKKGLPFKFEYDIIENNGIPKEKFGDDFMKLIGDVLLHIIIAQSEDGTLEPINRTNNAQ